MSRYAVIDLEMCIVPSGEKRKQFGFGSEIIQIGAALLDESYEIADTFMTFVRPKFGFVDRFIERLTGIRPADVANAPEIAEALEAFLRWLPEDAVIVSWSTSDLKQITSEMACKHMELPALQPYLETWVDGQAAFSEKLKSTRCYKLSEALNIAAIYYEDGEHDALVDAKNTALLFGKMKREPVFSLSPYLIVEDEAEKDPFGRSALV